MSNPADMRARADFLEVSGDADSAAILRHAADRIEQLIIVVKNCEEVIAEQRRSLGILRTLLVDIVRDEFAKHDACATEALKHGQ